MHRCSELAIDIDPTNEPSVVKTSDTVPEPVRVRETFGPDESPTLEPVDLFALLVQGGEDDAQAESGVADIVYWESIVVGWERITTSWPLPVPGAYPFPASPEPIMGGTLYDVTYGLGEAWTWWMCAVQTAAVEAKNDGDLATAHYWLKTLPLWGSTEAAGSLTADGDGNEAAYHHMTRGAFEGDWSDLNRRAASCITHTLR